MREQTIEWFNGQIDALNAKIHQQNSSLCLAKEIAEKNERLTEELADLKAILSDSKAVHLNILRGTIQLTKEQALHIAGADGLKERIKELESENTTLRNAQKACEDCDGPTMARVKELEQDKARLDWVESHTPNLCFICEFNGPCPENMTGTHASVDHAKGESTGATMREAIDSAMQTNKETK